MRFERVLSFCSACCFLNGEMLLEPRTGQPCSLGQRSRFLEEMGCAGNDLKTLFVFNGKRRLFVKGDNRRIIPADDEQGRRSNVAQRRPRQIGASTPGNHGGGQVWSAGGSNQRRSRARTRAKVADLAASQVNGLTHPGRSAQQPLRQEGKR